MIKKVSVLLLVSCLFVLLSGCSSQKNIQMSIDSDEIVSLSISGYPIIFANGDSIDITTDTVRISEVASAFSNVTFEKYKAKEEWDKIGPSPTGSAKATITFYNSEKEALGCFTRVTNAEGTFIYRIMENDVYTLSDKDFTTLNEIYETLLEDAEAGRLNN